MLTEFTILYKETKKELQRATLYSQNQINQNRPKNSLFQPKRVYFKVKIEIFAFQFQLKLNSLLPGLPKGPFPAEIWIWQAQQVSSLYLFLILQHYVHKPSGTKGTQIYKKNATFEDKDDD